MELIVAVVIPFLIASVCAWIRFRPSLNLHPIPVTALLVVITGSVIGHEFFHIASGPIPVTIDRLLILATFAMFGWLFLIGKEDLRPLNRLDFAILGVLGVTMLSMLAHDWRLLNNMPASRMLFFYLIPAALYWVVRTSRICVADLKFIGATLGLFGVYLALTGIAEAKGLTQFVYPRYIMTSDITEFLGRGRGPFLNPVSNGIFQTVCFCCVLMWWPRAKTNMRFVILAVAGILVVGIYATLTRSVWLGLVAACGWFIWVPASPRAKSAMFLAVTIFGILLFPVLSEKIFSFKRDTAVTQTEMEQSAQMRPMFAEIAWNMFQDRPLVGVGFGQYARAKYPYLDDPHTTKPLSITKGLMQHNVFLAYLTETGLIGLSALLLMLSQMGWVSWKVWRDRSLDLWARQFGLLAIVILTAYVLNGLFHDTSIIPMQHMLMFFLLGVVNNIFTRPGGFSDSLSEDGDSRVRFPTEEFAAGSRAA